MYINRQNGGKMKFRTIALLGILFMITFVSGGALASYMQRNADYNLTFLNPEENWDVGNAENDANTVPVSNDASVFSQLPERSSPFDRVKEDQIEVYDDKIVINLKNAEWAKFTDTNSMDPVIDAGANAIEIRPVSEEDVHVGDIISYDDGNGDIIIHRVADIGNDQYGWYAITKGDNAPTADAGKVRFYQVERVVAVIIY